MASLMKLLFDTMPLAGVRHAIMQESTQEVAMTSGMEVEQSTSVPFESRPLSSLIGRVLTIAETEQSLLSIPCVPLTEQQRRGDPTRVPVWGFDASSTPLHAIANIELRSQEEGYRRARVLDAVEFGLDEDGLLLPEVEVEHPNGAKQRLPLDETALIATFLTGRGSADETCESAWPVPASHQYGLVRVFLYDIDPNTGEVIVAKAIRDPELDEFAVSCQLLRGDTQRGGLVEELFTDDAWPSDDEAEALSAAVVDEFDELIAAAAAAGDSAELERLRTELEAALAQQGSLVPALDAAVRVAQILKSLEGLKVVRFLPHRIVVCCFLSLHHVSDDFTPQRPAWAARLYPVVMMQSTRPLKSFRAATSYTRPATTTIDDNPEAECACEEMKRGINVLLVADSNPGDKPPLVKIPVIGGLVEPNVGPPIPLWDRIFAYTVANAFDSLKSQRIRVVYDHEDPAGRAKVLPGALRFDDQVRDNHRLRRQGAFDNVHFAPPMQLKRKITRIAIMKGFVPVAEAHLADVDMERWHFNDITMAPICAHDCFHLHWRWGEEPVNPDDLTAFGWGGGGVCGKPYTERGNPLIPKNQELFIRLTSKRSMIYEATARRVEARTWQVIGHHGAAYITDTGFMVDLGRRTQDLFAVAGLVPTVYAELDEIAKGAEGELSALVNWALFYWRNRFTIRSDGTGPIERTEINDLQAILTGKPRPGRH